jgi:hypothetical protein
MMGLAASMRSRFYSARPGIQPGVKTSEVWWLQQRQVKNHPSAAPLETSDVLATQIYQDATHQGAVGARLDQNRRHNDYS